MPAVLSSGQDQERSTGVEPQHLVRQKADGIQFPIGLISKAG
jgi:hypothetical protein